MPLSRWSRRHKRTFGKKKQDESKVFLEEHRVPPKPTAYYTEDKGKCRYCGHWIYTERGEINLRKSCPPIPGFTGHVSIKRSRNK